MIWGSAGPLINCSSHLPPSVRSSSRFSHHRSRYLRYVPNVLPPPELIIDITVSPLKAACLAQLYECVVGVGRYMDRRA